MQGVVTMDKSRSFNTSLLNLCVPYSQLNSRELNFAEMQIVTIVAEVVNRDLRKALISKHLQFV